MAPSFFFFFCFVVMLTAAAASVCGQKTKLALRRHHSSSPSAVTAKPSAIYTAALSWCSTHFRFRRPLPLFSPALNTCNFFLTPSSYKSTGSKVNSIWETWNHSQVWLRSGISIPMKLSSFCSRATTLYK